MCCLAHIYSGDLVGEVQIRNLTEQRLCPLSRVVLVRRSVLSSSRQQRSELTEPEGRQVLVPSGPAR